MPHRKIHCEENIHLEIIKCIDKFANLQDAVITDGTQIACFLVSIGIKDFKC